MGHIGNQLESGGIVVCEHERELELEDGYKGLALHKRYKYGKTAVTVFRAPQEDI